MKFSKVIFEPSSAVAKESGELHIWKIFLVFASSGRFWKSSAGNEGSGISFLGSQYLYTPVIRSRIQIVRII